jgi:hypothetical protein
MGPRGADCVLELAVMGRLANAGAALGGLLMLANPDVNEKLRTIRAAVELPAATSVLEEMSLCSRGYVHAATVEFWLEWLEELVADFPRSRQAFDRAANALLRLREAMVERVVLGGHRSLLSASLGAPRDIGRAVPLDRFAASIASRFAALAAAAPESESLRSAALAWSMTH